MPEEIASPGGELDTKHLFSYNGLCRLLKMFHACLLFAEVYAESKNIDCSKRYKQLIQRFFLSLSSFEHTDVQKSVLQTHE